MKNGKLLLGAFVVILVIVLVIVWASPKSFVWTPTFLQEDKEPFGEYVFDSVMANSCRNGYQVRHTSLEKWAKEKGRKETALYVCKDLNLENWELKKLVAKVKAGNQVILVASESSDSLANYLGVVFESSLHDPFDVNSLRSSIADKFALVNDTVIWNDSLSGAPKRNFINYSMFYDSYVYQDSIFLVSDGSVLAYNPTVKTQYDEHDVYEDDDDEYSAGRITGYDTKEMMVVGDLQMGKGKFVFCSTPLLFTNYGILDGKSRDLVMRVLSRGSNLPVVRIQDVGEEEEAKDSPFYVLLKYPSSRLAYLLLLLGGILFMIFTARRRQRVIPVVARPQNKALDFIQMIGTLYYRNKDHTDLTSKKFVYFSAIVRMNAGVDVESRNDIAEASARLSVLTGMDEEQIRHRLQDLQQLHDDHTFEIRSRDMKMYVDWMDEVLRKI